MIQIFSPHPDWKQVLHLPNPEWGDVERLESTVQLKRSMNGNTVVTHIRSVPNSFTNEMDFELDRLKSLELLEWFNIHAGSLMKLIDHNGVVRIGYLKVNPLDLEKVKKANSTEAVRVRLDFESTESVERP